MARHVLIDAHLGELRRRLPASAYDELADGLIESYEHNLGGGQRPDDAAATAVGDFGTIEQITAAFAADAPGRRTARALLLSGPLVGLCWAASFIAAKAWTWPISAGVAVAFGIGLSAVIAVLAVAVNTTSYPRTRLTAVSGAGAVLLDSMLLLTTITMAPAVVWPMALAIPASLIRMGYTLHALPRIVAD